MAGPLAIETLWGERTRPAIPALARLRVTVFRDFPYLYEGSAEYEEKYLAKYIDLPDGIDLSPMRESHAAGRMDTGRHEQVWLRPGHTVLLLGTGGVSIFALQLGVAAGGRVIVT